MLSAIEAALVGLATTGPDGFIILAAAVAVNVAIEYFVVNRKVRRVLSGGLLAISLISVAIFGFVTGAGRANLLVQKRNTPSALTSEINVSLVDVRSLRGWGEGPVSLNGTSVTRGVGDKSVDRDVSVEAYTKLLQDVRVSVSGAQLKAMDQRAWENFLKSLDDKERNKLGARSWAHIKVSVGQHVIHFREVFRGETVAIVHEGRTLGRLRLTHLFNVADLVSDEPESVIIDFTRA